MAYFRKLPSGNWRAEIELLDVRDSLGGFPTKRDAQEWATFREQEIRAGKAGKFPDKTLAEALLRYEKEISPTKESEHFEVLRFEALRRKFPKLVEMRLVDVKPDDLQEWVDARLEKVKPATVRRESNSFSNVWTVAAKVWKWCPLESPWSFVRVPSDGQPRERRIPWQEVRRLCRALGYISGKPPQSMQAEVAYAFLIALRTAMRSSEILGLTTEAVNLETRVVKLDKHKTLRYTGRPRFIPFRKPAKRLLAAMMAGRAVKLFTVSDDSRAALFVKAKKRCGIKGLTFHDSRGEALTLLSRKVDVQTLQKISGHADINVLIRHYYRESPEQVAARI
ncbi:tyrosine-type recombinase/integrase [Roseateles sp. PN1]|uniref:tyrosine-type recombinase/integrase n=1 Tax=Roseateles sp. PN1 TaxID=3137372 RepID=UPI0031395170